MGLNEGDSYSYEGFRVKGSREVVVRVFPLDGENAGEVEVIFGLDSSVFFRYEWAVRLLVAMYWLYRGEIGMNFGYWDEREET